MKMEKGKWKDIKRKMKRPHLIAACISLFFIFHFSFFIYGCARQGYPTGGPKDEEPPVALRCKPDNGSRHFAADEFYIQFDEYVVLKNPSGNILVSPPMKQQPEYTTKGKGILVKIKDTLQENATYLFQFKEAIADFNEGNLLPSFEYVFSTGDAMDTLMLEGRVINPLNGKPWKETITVAAYNSVTPALHDSVSPTPSFVTRCDKQGNFAFHCLPEGHYHLIAFEDKNRNLLLDSTEAVAWDTAAFNPHPIPDSSSLIIRHSSPIILFISQPETQRQHITSSAFSAKGRILITSQLPMQSPSIEGPRNEWRLNSRKDTLTLWCLDAKTDSARLVIHDPSGLQDTLKLRFIEQKKGKRQRAGGKEETIPLMKTLCDGSKAFYDDLRLAFENPIVTMRDSAQAEILHLKDSILTLCPLAIDSTGLTARLLTSLKSGEQYRIHLQDSLFTDIFGHCNDSLTFSLTPKDYGTLTLHIDNQTGLPLVIEVLDKRDTIVQSQSLNSKLLTLNFSRLPAGDYRLRAILDVNGDGHWTPGNYYLNRQPEQAVFFEKTLSLREKWEMEERWNVKMPTERNKMLKSDPIKTLDIQKGGEPLLKPKE